MSNDVPGDPSGRPLAPATLAVSLGRPPRSSGEGVNPAIELSTTFHAHGAVAYGREDNSTWRAFEEVVAGLEGGAHGVTYPSGLAAVEAVLTTVPLGGIVVSASHPYSGTRARLMQREAQGRLTTRWVDCADAEAVADAMDGADLALLESPTNPFLEVCDLRAAAVAARENGVMLVVDNTFATPLGQQPLQLGATAVLHSGTKYLAGHSDVLVGVIVTNDAALAETLRKERTLSGSIAGPLETFLALRGLRTLQVRYERTCANALDLAERLSRHPAVFEVRYPGLPQDPGHARASGQMTAFGGIIGLRVRGGAARAESVADACQLWTHATSLGGVESLIERRAQWPLEHPDLPDDHLRLSVGIEDVDDLWHDLSRALS